MTTTRKEPNKKINIHSVKRRRDLIFYTLLLVWPMAQFTVFYIGVNFNSVLLAFKNYESEGAYSWAGFENFSTLFSMFKNLTVFRVGLRNSLTLFFVGTVLGIALGLLFSFYIYKKMPAGGFFRVILFLPSIIPSIAMIVMFKQFADNAVPAVCRLLFHVEIRGLLANPDTTFGTIIFYNIWVGFGTASLLYVGAMTNISESVVEAARLDGAGFFREFVSVTLPLVWDTISTFVIIAVGGIFINQANVYAFYGGGAEENVATIGYWLYKETVKIGGYASYPMLSAFGLLLSFVTMPLVYFAKWLLRKIGPTMD